MIYKCRKGCATLAFDAATEAAFRCPKCDSKLAWHDNAHELREIEQRIATIEKILSNQSGYANV